MRKIILTFTVILFCQPQTGFGQHGIDFGTWDIPSELELIILLPLAIPYMLFKDKKKFSCSLPWHPGDYYYEKNNKVAMPFKIKLKNCQKKCLNMSMNEHLDMDYHKAECYKNRWGKYTSCLDDAMKFFPYDSISFCKKVGTDGFYSDDSYYSSSIGTKHNYLGQLFKNTHELKDTYEKNEWQKARDECMEIASKIKRKSFDNSVVIFKKTYDAYNECLKERGF